MSLELKNVEKKIGLDTHIYPTNLKLQKNTINILLGSTLAGKTTLMQIMAGLDKPTSGLNTFTLTMSDKNCENQLFITIPPSTLTTFGLKPSCFIASNKSYVW